MVSPTPTGVPIASFDPSPAARGASPVQQSAQAPQPVAPPGPSRAPVIQPLPPTPPTVQPQTPGHMNAWFPPIPLMPPGAAAPPPGPPADATVRKSSLTPLTSSGEVMVVAFVCGHGHYSPPYASTCRVCGMRLDQNQPVLEVPRPALGVLRLWGGGVVLLDRGVVFGRNPHPITGVVGPEPSLVKIEDPNRDVSSQHCEVRLEDWFVTVRDLDSTNGTQVILPHRPPVALRANDPMAIEPGTRVVLANAFDFVFEVAT